MSIIDSTGFPSSLWNVRHIKDTDLSVPYISALQILQTRASDTIILR